MKNNFIDIYKVLNKYYSLPLFSNSTNDIYYNYDLKNIDLKNPVDVELLIAVEPKDLRIALAGVTMILNHFSDDNYQKCLNIAINTNKYCLRRICYFYEIARIILIRQNLTTSAQYSTISNILNDSTLLKNNVGDEWIDLLQNNSDINYSPIPPSFAGEKWKILGEPPFQKYEEFYYMSKRI